MKKSRSIESIIYDYHRAIDDLIDDYQRRLAKTPTWTNEKRQLVRDLDDSLKKAEFGYYHVNPADCGGPLRSGLSRERRLQRKRLTSSVSPRAISRHEPMDPRRPTAHLGCRDHPCARRRRFGHFDQRV